MTWQNQQNECAPSEDSDQPGHPPSLIRVFAVRMKKAWVLSYPLSPQRRLWSDWVDAQADLNLHWAHSHFVGFVMLRLICRSSFDRLFILQIDQFVKRQIWALHNPKHEQNTISAVSYICKYFRSHTEPRSENLNKGCDAALNVKLITGLHALANRRCYCYILPR